MWRRERDKDVLAEYLATREPVEPAENTPRFTAGLPAARPTTAGERHEFELVEKSDPKSTRKVATRLILHSSLAALGIFAAFQIGNRDSDSAPAVGECGKNVADHKVAKVDCDDDTAEFRVTSRVDDVTDGEAACATDAAATSYYAYQSGHSVVKFVLCLADMDPRGR